MGNVQIDVDRDLEFNEIHLYDTHSFGLVFSDGDGDSLEFVIHIKDLSLVCNQLKKAYEVMIHYLDESK